MVLGILIIKLLNALGRNSYIITVESKYKR